MTLDVLKNILFTKEDAYALEGRLKTELATKDELLGLKAEITSLKTELDRKPNTEGTRTIVNSEMNKAAEVMRLNFEERDEKIKNHEKRLRELETPAPSN